MHGDPARNVVAAALSQHYSVLPDSIVWSSGAVTTAGVGNNSNKDLDLAQLEGIEMYHAELMDNMGKGKQGVVSVSNESLNGWTVLNKLRSWSSGSIIYIAIMT
ncbi:hypothetical protein NC651_034860 [Populus alba x Populus x berolinensis]|nr:hypothetical protein NC651_034860 [Populus alba x Populus x berolinensis]